MNGTIRHVGIGVGLIIQGAIARAEYGEGETAEDYKQKVCEAVARELGDWMEDSTPAQRLAAAQGIDDNLVHDELGTGVVTNEAVAADQATGGSAT